MWVWNGEVPIGSDANQYFVSNRAPLVSRTVPSVKQEVLYSPVASWYVPLSAERKRGLPRG